MPKTVYGRSSLKPTVNIRTGGYGTPLDFTAPNPDVVKRAPQVRRAPRPRLVRTPRQANAPPGSAEDDDPHEVAAELAAFITELGPLPGCTLARLVRRRD